MTNICLSLVDSRNTSIRNVSNPHFDVFEFLNEFVYTIIIIYILAYSNMTHKLFSRKLKFVYNYYH